MFTQPELYQGVGFAPGSHIVGRTGFRRFLGACNLATTSSPVIIPANGVSSNGSEANFYDRIRVSSSNPTTYPILTIRAWVKVLADRNTFSGWGALNKALEAIFYCGTYADGMNHCAYFGAADYDSGVSMGFDWHHVCYTYDGTTVKIYQDGVEVGSAALGYSPNGPESLSFLRTAFTGEWFDGAIQAPAVWERTLTPAEVAADVFQLTPVLTTDLWAWWLLSDADDVTDRSGNGRDLTRNGTPVTVPGPGIPL